MRFGLSNEIWNADPWDWSELWPTRWFRKSYPAINVYGNEDRLVVTSEIPGISLEDLNVQVQGRTLNLKGKRGLPEANEEECYSCEERMSGEFVRSVGLPYDVDPGKVEAQYNRGVLTLKLPRAENTKPRKISIRTS